MLYCYTCGHGNEDGARFCFSCGRAVQVAGVAPPPPQAVHPQQLATSPMAIAGVVIGAVGLVLAILGDFVGFLWPFFCAIAGFVICFVAIRQNRNRIRPLIITGLVLNVVAFWTAIFIAILFAVDSGADSNQSTARSSNGQQTYQSTGSQSSDRDSSTNRQDSGADDRDSSTDNGDSGSSRLDKQYTFGTDGHYVVGEDIAPGAYGSAGLYDPAKGSCIFARLRTAGASINDSEEVIDSGRTNYEERIIVYIAPSDGAFFTHNCGHWFPMRGD